MKVPAIGFLVLLATASWMQIKLKHKWANFIVGSRSFPDGGEIPVKYSPYGENISPEVHWSEIPPGTKSFAITMTDSGAPSGEFAHWVVYNIPADATSISEGSKSGISAKNSLKINGYKGPFPPSGVHIYKITVYALSKKLSNVQSIDSLKKAMLGSILSEWATSGTFKSRLK